LKSVVENERSYGVPEIHSHGLIHRVFPPPMAYGGGPNTTMTTPSTNTVRLHRVLRAKPGKVYRAFLDADAMAKWLPPYGFTCKVHHMDAKVGGTFKITFTNFSTGNGHSFGGTYLEIKANELLRYTDTFDDPGLPGQMITPRFP
jgi:uncharacterized protein YndB with AHSA1/START domain